MRKPAPVSEVRKPYAVLTDLVSNLWRRGMPRLEWIAKEAVLNHHREIPFRLLKCDDELSVGIGVTLLARWPGRIQPASIIRGLMSHVDLLPTLLEIVGEPVPDKVQGRSLLPLFGRPDGAGRDCIFGEKSWHGNEYDPMRCIRIEHYKYIRNFAEGWLYQMPLDIKMAPADRVMEATRRKSRPAEELYDLRANPRETNNLAGDHRFQEVQADLSRRLTQWQSETGDPLPRIPRPVVAARQGALPEQHAVSGTLRRKSYTALWRVTMPSDGRGRRFATVSNT